MTWGADKKSAEPSSIVQNGPSSAGPDPGKRSRTQGPNYTGSAYADHGALCDAQPDGDGCFWPPRVRDHYMPLVVQRIAAVGTTFLSACDVVKLERLMTPATQPSFVAGLLFDVVLGAWTGGIIENFVKIRAAAVQSATAMELELSGLMKMEASTLNAKLATGVSKVKGVVVQSAGTGAPAVAQSFIAALRNSAAIGFQTLREGIPASSTDVELASFFEAFDIALHPLDLYTRLINAKVDNYLKSGVTDIGRKADSSKKTVSTKEDTDPYASVDTRVAWARFASGYPPQLVYEHASSRDLGGKDQPQFGGADTQSASATKPGLAGDTGARLVPHEFADIALQRHIAMWGGLPGFVDVDDSQWYWDMPRAQAAYQRRQTQQSSVQVADRPNKPKLDLSPSKDAPIDVPDALTLKPAAGGAP